jgi:uncharacterized protein YndB with AHSA1/START domain
MDTLYHMNKQIGIVTMEGDHVTPKYERRLPHTAEALSETITDPKELAMWFNNKAVIDARNGGTIDFVTGPAGFHTAGRTLVCDPPHVFEHEWRTAPHPQLPNGEPDAVIRWELVRDSDFGTILTLTFSCLTKPTSLVSLQECMRFLIGLKPSLKENLCQIGCCDTTLLKAIITLRRHDDLILASKKKSDIHRLRCIAHSFFLFHYDASSLTSLFVMRQNPCRLNA